MAGEEIFGRYRLIRPLGQGGMARVDLAHQLGLAAVIDSICGRRAVFGDEPLERWTERRIEAAGASIAGSRATCWEFAGRSAT